MFSHRGIEHFSQWPQDIVPTSKHRGEYVGVVLVTCDHLKWTLAFSTSLIPKTNCDNHPPPPVPHSHHALHASRAAQRDRAPEDIVKNLPWRVWNGTRWEKADGTPHTHVINSSQNNNLTIDGSNEGNDELDRVEQGSSRTHLPWYATQAECAICLEEFAVGDKVRVLPCEHVFHMNEIDDWLINRKKLVSALLLSRLRPLRCSACRICSYESAANGILNWVLVPGM